MAKELGLRVLTGGTERLSRLIFPYKIEQGSESLLEARRLLQNGKGIILLINHFSTRDAIQGLQVLMRYLAPYSAKTVMPLARHMYKPWMAGVLKNLNVETYPIADFNWEEYRKATENLSADGRREFKMSAKESYKKYLENAEIALNNGGLVGLASQARREPKLRAPRAFPVATLLGKTNVKVDDVFLFCVGIGFAGVKDYSTPEVRGYNKGENFVVKIGEVFNLGEVLRRIQKDRNFKNIDYWIYKKLIPLVPPEYLG